MHAKLLTPRQSSVLALTCLAARAVNLHDTEWQDYRFPKKPYTMQRLPPPGGSILFDIGMSARLQLSCSSQTSGLYANLLLCACSVCSNREAPHAP